MPIASTSIRPSESAQWIPATKVGNPISISASVSRDHVSATIPCAPRGVGCGGEQLAPVGAVAGRDDHHVARGQRVDGRQLAAIPVVGIGRHVVDGTQ